MSQLFSKSAIRQAISSFQGLNIDKEIAIVQELYTDFRNGNMKDETRYEQRFNDLFFGQLLDYESGKHRIPQAPTPVGGKRADVALGFFEDNKYTFESVKVMVEFKGSDTLLDKKQASYGGQSPVDQGFGYKTSFKDCPWLIVSNFASVRLYRDNKQDFEVWTIEELANPNNEYYNLKTLLGLLKRNHLISQSGTSFSEKLLSEVRIKQEQITKSFYKAYKTLRFELINDIRHHNPEIHVETVVEKAQKIIDRIIFIHFCEDKGLLPEGKLKTNVIRAREADFSPWDVLKKYFKGVDSGSDKLEIPHGYNGGLFHTDPVLNDLEIGDAICHKFIDLGNYSFDDELSVNILGHIFEQSISDIEQLKGELIESTVIARNEAIHSQGTTQDVDRHGHTSLAMTTTENQLVEKKESKRKKDGIFYTPEYIVDYIVQNSLMVYLEEKENECLAKYKKENEAYQAYQHILQNIKVLDPACGSGAFLVKVFDYLYAENKRVGQIVKSLFDDDEIYKSILRNNIYGVDLNPESVEITKLSLWLKSAQKGKKLNNLDDNIKCGNSLIDDPAVVGDRAFDWQKEFSDIMGAGGFDVIVGNPPYGAKLDELSKEYCKETFSNVHTRTIETFNYFISRSQLLLKNNGVLSFIIPNNLLFQNEYEKTRLFLLEENKLYLIINLGDSIFEDATVPSCMFFIRKSINGKYTINYGDVRFTEQKNNLNTSIIYNNYEIKNIPGSIFGINPNVNNIIDKVSKKSFLIDDIAEEVASGISTGGDKIFRIKQNIVNQYSLESDLLKKCLVGGNIGKYYINFEGDLLIYTNREIEINSFENIKIYLEQFKEKLNSRAEAKIGLPRYSLGRQRYKELFEEEKIIVRQTSDSIIATYDKDGFYVLNSILVLKIQKEYKNIDYKFIISILNSRLNNFIYKNFTQESGRVFAEVKPINVRKLFIPKISLSEQQPFIDKADLMLSLNKELHDKTDSFLRYISSKFGLEKLSTKLSKFYDYDFATFLKELKFKKLSMTEEAELMEFFENKKSEIVSLKNRIDRTDKEIDEMVFELYGLSEEERAVVLG